MTEIPEEYAEIPVADRPHPVLPPRYSIRPNIVIVGAGGTGGFVAESLCRLFIGYPATLTIVDHDMVEPHNLLRQNFYDADVGHHKSKVLAERLSAHYQRPISYCTQPVRDDGSRITPELIHHPNLVVACVDNAEARIALDRLIDCIGHAWLIDAGNGDTWGQVLIGNYRDTQGRRFTFQDGRTYRLPSPLVQRPDLATDPPDRPRDIDCAAAMDLTDQDPTINHLMAALTVQTVRRLMAGTLTYMSLYAEQSTGSVSPVQATPRNVARILGVEIDELLA